MKKTNNLTAFYDSPVVEIVEIETASILCSSSEELDDLNKEEGNFNWGY